jgi:Uma2 family endonuclease
MSRRGSHSGGITVDRYLELESSSPIRHEYVYGELRAMSGGSLAHGLIISNLVAAFRGRLRGTGCHTYTQSAKVRAGTHLVYYPDIVVECGGKADARQVIDAPTLIAEVLSPSTQSTDRGEKVVAYCAMQSLAAYVIVDSRRRRVIVYARTKAGDWDRLELSGNDVIDLSALDATIALDEIYEGVSLPPLAVGEEMAEDDDVGGDA